MAAKRLYSQDRLIKKNGGNKVGGTMADASSKIVGMLPTVVAIGIMERTTRMISKKW